MILIYSLGGKKDKRLQVCFTGFGATDKNILGDLADSKDLNVVAFITAKLDYLVCGENAGEKKIEKAESQVLDNFILWGITCRPVLNTMRV